MCIILQTHIENVTTEEIPILCKVENILKGSLDSIPSPSPSVKIQIMGGKVCLRCLRQDIAGRFWKKRFVNT